MVSWCPHSGPLFLLSRVNWIDLDGILYKIPCSLVVRNKEVEDFPTFGKLLDVYVADTKVYFEVQEYKTVDFNSHFHCFIVQLSTVKQVVCHDDLFCVHPHYVRLLPGTRGTQCIIPKYHFVSV